MTTRGGEIKRAVKTYTPSKMEKEWTPSRRMELPCLYCEGMVRYEARLHEAMDFVDRRPDRRPAHQGSTLEGYCTTACFFLHRVAQDVQRRRFFTLADATVPANQATFPQLVPIEERVRIPIEIPWRNHPRKDNP